MLEPGREVTNLETDFLPDFSRQTLIEELQRLARELGMSTLSKRDIKQHGRVSYDTVVRHCGTLRQALQAAALRPTRFTKASTDELLDTLKRTWVVGLDRFGRRPRKTDLRESPDLEVVELSSIIKSLPKSEE